MSNDGQGESLRELALFAGAGGGILGGYLLGWRTVCAVEIEDYPRRVILARQRDGMLPRFPIWDDVTTFDGTAWRGRVDVISGGFPCQDISAAGKGAGITGARSGLWTHMARIIGEVRPRHVFVENSPLLVSRGLDVVLDSLAALGYSASWGIVGAHHAGAPHKRDRIWIKCELADTSGAGPLQHEHTGTSSGGKACRSACQQGKDGTGGNVDYAMRSGLEGTHDYREPSERIYPELGERREDVADAASIGQQGSRTHWYASDPAETREGEADRAWAERVGHIWGLKSSVGRVAHGVANRVDRLAAIGNGQVPSVAALAWRLFA